jgi:cell division protein ZapA (FtsZ GTPase activity inhibitor)
MGGQEYRIRSDADPAWLQRVAAHVDESMARIRNRTDTVDSLAIATLAALNIARELLELKEGLGATSPGETVTGGPAPNGPGADPDRLRALIERAEAAAGEAGA